MLYKLFRTLRKQPHAFLLFLASVAIVEYLIWAPLIKRTHTRKPSFSTRMNGHQELSSGLIAHTWYNICGTSVDVLRKWPHFPFFPDKQAFISDFKRSQDSAKTDYGERVFGFIHPQKSGVYTFAITSDDESELWLSLSEDSAASEKIACVCDPGNQAWTNETDYKKYPRQISKQITLHAGKKYYIESLMKQSNHTAHIAVYWAYGSSNFTFEIISSEYLTPFSRERNKDSIPLHASKQIKSSAEWNNDLYDLNNLQVINREEYIRAIPSCSYSPSFLSRQNISKNNTVNGVHHANGHLSYVFPEDDTDMFTEGHQWSRPNPVINKARVESVVDFILRSLRSSSYRSRNYVLQKIFKVILKPDPKNGDRFLLDLILRAKNTNQMFRLTEHVYQKKGSNDFCLPEGISWKRNATVYFIIPVKDQGKWVHYLINQVTKASLLSGDKNFHIIIADFESKDIDMPKAFNTSLLRSRHTIVPFTGRFYKTLALNKAVDFVPNMDDIIFLFDLHIDVPADILDNIRKSTIAGRTVYFPMVGRLDCGCPSDVHRGFWEWLGFGLLSIYKSDWCRFGGMDAEGFKYSWGGEDWELLRRVLNAQFEVERIKHPGLYHHHHPKIKNWNKDF